MSLHEDHLTGEGHDDLEGVEVAFELHTYHRNYWLVVKKSPNRALMTAAADQLVAARTVDGARVARVENHVGFDFIDRTIVYKQLLPKIIEADPLAPARDLEAPAHCQGPADFVSDRSRQEIRSALARFLEERHLTPLELLHSERHLAVLQGAGTTLQGVLQRAAMAQVQGTQTSAVSRFKELLQMADTIVSEARHDAEVFPPPTIAPGRFAEVHAELAGRFDPAALDRQGYRALAAFLHGTTSWVDKLDRLGDLCVPDLGLAPRRLLDAAIAEVFQGPGVIRELLPDARSRYDAMLLLVDLYVGRTRPEFRSLLGLENILQALAAKRLPRTRAYLRQRLIRELSGRHPLLSGAGLVDELTACNDLTYYIKEHAPELLGGLELKEVMEMRAGRSINPDAVSESLSSAAGTVEKVRVLIQISELTPGDENRAVVGKYFQAVFNPRDLVQEAARGTGNRIGAIAPLVELHQTVQQSLIDPETKQMIAHDIDGAIYEVFRTDIMGARNRPYGERMLLLARMCAALVLPEGRARSYAASELSRAARKPEFLPAFLKPFKSEADQRLAVARLRALLDGAPAVPDEGVGAAGMVASEG